MIEITMPRLSDTMEEGAITTWLKKPGDRVDIGDVLVEIETDKANMELEAYEAGTLSKILVPEGELVPIGTPIALLDDGKPGDSTTPIAAPLALAVDSVAEPAEAAAATPEAPGRGSEADLEVPSGDRLFASPFVRKLARENHLDLGGIRGTGPGGRIIRADLDEVLPHSAETGPSAAEAPAAVPPPSAVASPANRATQQGDEKRGSEAVSISNTRRVIARRLGESARSIPHFYVTAVADAEALVGLRTELNEQLTAAGRTKVSINDLLIRASALALRENPLVNVSYVDDASTTMLLHHRINVGVAVASENGLVVPVIENADQKSVSQLGLESRTLVALANAKKLTSEQMSGGTFTISNLGMFGVEHFTAIINPPEGAILAVGGTTREPVVVGDEIVPRYRMRFTLSADHRIIDGALAAQFLQTLTRLIENPGTIIA
ncbi:dihydrolipoamide acetyltransferase family protein [Lacisediminihabitans profunda]|uniref:Dihydrolipoamide acetyltransferase component of pyruvate dehydrogenase complex n=1 Tax=Lacisediminihabitans profunda TaxID=2594790 RepID=A0A5C8UV44_9MICO|nr:dihydrolipoamide acetyltransferase family protein [Lacisediminihabitans profunda]TXN31869.1 2-oxo acid dehydrogenase subunit E2 [Lacisediminihabitans profunda]